MVRFSAEEQEIAALLRFLARRSPGGLWMLPLEAEHRGELRFRRTARLFLSRLREQDNALSWGLLPLTEVSGAHGDAIDNTGAARRRRIVTLQHEKNSALEKTDSETASSPRLTVDADASGLIVLALGPALGDKRRRDGVLLTRDPVPGVPPPPRPASKSAPLPPAPPHLSPEANRRRDELVEKSARRLRRKGQQNDGRWIL